MSICGANCVSCPSKNECGGCDKTKGKPFGKKCMLYSCCENGGVNNCDDCHKSVAICRLKQDILSEINALGLDMPVINELYPLKGSFANMEYEFPCGRIKLLDDDKIYFGNQVQKSDGSCYGFAADEDYLLVCEYGENGANPSIVLFKKR